jgi:membrane-bound lytic murein transglycosylase
VSGDWPDHSAALCEVASETRRYLARGPGYDPAAIHGGTLDAIATPLPRIEATLDYLCAVQQADAKAGRPSRLADAAFLAQAFEWLHWSPDRAKAASLAEGKPLLQRLPADQILLTKYYVRIASGATRKSAATPQALYGLPYDEAALSLEEADARRGQITRYRLGKQAILQGALEQAELAPPLIWLSRADLEGALLQGTAVIEQDGQRRYFNVHRNNGIAYDRSRRPEEQERYWYFKEVPGMLGYGKDADYKIPVRPQVTVAGDIFQLGLGRLILLHTTEHGRPTYRLTILADTGGAFHDNLYQLDWLSGYYRDWADYHTHNRHIGDYAHTWLLLKRKDAPRP